MLIDGLLPFFSFDGTDVAMNDSVLLSNRAFDAVEPQTSQTNMECSVLILSKPAASLNYFKKSLFTTVIRCTGMHGLKPKYLEIDVP